MEFLRFIFSSFWVWLGFIILLSLIVGGLIGLAQACKKDREVQVSFYPGSVCPKIVTIKRASTEDVKKALDGTENISSLIEEGRNGNK